MINWDKPIETIDGRKARLVEMNTETFEYIVYTYGKCDVFLVTCEGYRCDDRAIYSERQEPFIRNARVKREGWVVKYKGINHIHDDQIYPSEESAISKIPVGCVVVRIQWEE